MKLLYLFRNFYGLHFGFHNFSYFTSVSLIRKYNITHHSKCQGKLLFFVFLFIRVFETLFHICECFLPFFVIFLCHRNSACFADCLYFFLFYCFLRLRQFYSPSSNSTNHTKVFLHLLYLDNFYHRYKYPQILCDN